MHFLSKAQRFRFVAGPAARGPVLGGSGCKHTAVCCSSQGAAEQAVAGAGGLEHLGVELLTGSFLWFIDKLITMENSVAPSIFVWLDLLLDLTLFLVYCFVLIFFVLMDVATFLQKQQPWPLKQHKMLHLQEQPSEIPGRSIWAPFHSCQWRTVQFIPMSKQAPKVSGESQTTGW